MRKIVVLVLFGLIAIGALGWSLGNQPTRSPTIEPPLARPDSRFPVTATVPSRLRLEAETLAEWMHQGTPSVLLIDTRSADDFQQAHLKRAINRNVESLLSLQTLRRLPRHRPIVLYGNNEQGNASTVKVFRRTGLVAFYLGANSQIVDSLPVSDAPSTLASDSDHSSRHSSPQRPAFSVQQEPIESIPHTGASEGDPSTVQLGLLAD